MLTPTATPQRLDPTLRFQARYQRELSAALAAGIPHDTIAMVVDRFRFDPPSMDKLDALHSALVQYADMTTEET